MKQFTSDQALESAVAAAFAARPGMGGLDPHAVADELVGLENYRRLLRCPDTESLAAYADDSLDLNAALRIAAHEYRCPVCRADAADLRQFVEQDIAGLLARMPLW